MRKDEISEIKLSDRTGKPHETEALIANRVYSFQPQA